MKYCSNCGTQIADNAIFCEECGTKQTIEFIDTSTPAPSPDNNQKTPTTKTLGGCFLAVLAIILLIASVSFLFRSCESSPETLEEVSAEFIEALAIDFNAKKVVSLMSSDLIDYYMDDLSVSSEKGVISRLNPTFAINKENTIAYYGDDWKATIKEVEIIKEDHDQAIVIVYISHTGSDALWHTNIDDWRVYLRKENGEWRVYDFEGFMY